VGLVKQLISDQIELYCGECGNPYPSKCMRCGEICYDENECDICNTDDFIEQLRECYCEESLNW